MAPLTAAAAALLSLSLSLSALAADVLAPAATITAAPSPAKILAARASSESAPPLTEMTYAYSAIVSLSLRFGCPGRVTEAGEGGGAALVETDRGWRLTNCTRNAQPYQVNPYNYLRGPQTGYNICNSTTAGDKSMCQTLIMNDIDDFCLWGSPTAEGSSKPGSPQRIITVLP